MFTLIQDLYFLKYPLKYNKYYVDSMVYDSLQKKSIIKKICFLTFMLSDTTIHMKIPYICSIVLYLKQSSIVNIYHSAFSLKIS